MRATGFFFHFYNYYQYCVDKRPRVLMSCSCTSTVACFPSFFEVKKEFRSVGLVRGKVEQRCQEEERRRQEEEERKQKKIREIPVGLCPMSFRWRKIGTGYYQCEGGLISS